MTNKTETQAWLKFKKAETIEKYFLSIGWQHCSPYVNGTYLDYWMDIGLKDYDKLYELPDIIDHYPSFKKWVLERMEGEGIEFTNNSSEVQWWDADSLGPVAKEKIEDNEITLAAVEAATRYFKSVKEKG